MDVKRNRAADVLVGYAADREGRGIAYVVLATAGGRSIVRVSFATPPLALHGGREFGYAAVAAVGSELSRRGFSRVRLRLSDEAIVHDLAAPRVVAPALAMPYVKARCALNGFSAARVERADPRETADLCGRASAELHLRTAA